MRTLTRLAPAFLLGLVVSGCADDAETTERPTPSASPADPSPGNPSTGNPSTGDELTLDGGVTVVGEWEEAELLGDRLPAGEAFGLPRVVYAVADPDDGEQRALVSYGLLSEGRIFRTVPALSPEEEEAPDGMDLYGGFEEQGAYDLLGAVPGRVAVSVEAPDGTVEPVAAQSATVLPGWTVFHHRGPWSPDWDALAAAPLVVTTDDGVRVEVRERSWVG
ncbi:hypothetical protein [Nocardioides solisilvae]|uniref:hypothetical protein n=1 Tax=Nocardioides solisilvae TaxID=1542435 RepID=UPI0013A58701|nr:hypothetical protein [Nocardioides solisilvae]